MTKFRKIFEAKITNETNTLIAEEFKKVSASGRKYTFKEDGNTLIVTIKEEEPNTSSNKINEAQIERVIEACGGKMKMGRREQSGREIFNSGDIDNISGKRRLAWSFKDSSKYRTSTIKVF